MSHPTAIEIVESVKSGVKTPVETVQEALDRATAAADLNATMKTFADEALAAAAELGERSDLSSLPLAGLPILIKDCVPVAGHPMRVGSRATSEQASVADHEIVKRLKDAGAIVIGLTKVPELCTWGSTDSVYGITRNPWNPGHTPGGSSGGSAASVAAGVVPVAHATDGMGSIRIPAANCGLFGIKPGSDVVPADMGYDSWGGMSENGPVATTVEDAALVLSVLANDATLAEVAEPERPLRIAVAYNTPSFVVRLKTPWRRALETAEQALREAGHQVEVVRFPYPLDILPLLSRWFLGVANDARELDHDLLEPRTRRHVKLGLFAQKRGMIKAADTKKTADRARAFFADYDVLVTPTLAQTGPAAVEWHKRSWLRNLWSNLNYAPFAAIWNMVGWPAASVPIGMDSDKGLPTAVQLIAEPGGEKQLLGLAAQLQRIRPWQRTSPRYNEAAS